MTKDMQHVITTLLLTLLFFMGSTILNFGVKAAVNPKILSVSTNPTVIYSGNGASININSVNRGKVQYKVILLTQKTGKWEDVSGGYSPAVDSSKSYSIKMKKVFEPGKYKISVWIKKAGTNGKIKNSSGYGSYDNYVCIDKECLAIAKISSVTMVEGNLVTGMKPSIKISTIGTGQVQYKVMLYTEKTGKWEDASKGYTPSVNANSTFVFKFNKEFEEGKYKISVWVKKAGTEGIIKNSSRYGSYDNYLSINKECVYLPRILSANIVEQNITSGMQPSIKLITQGSGQVQYRVFVSNENTNKFEDVSNGYTTAVNVSEPYVIKLSKDFKEGNNKISIWVKRAGTDGVIYNSSGHGSYDNYITINKEVSFTPKITSVEITNESLIEGIQPTISIVSKWKDKVQYRVFLSTEITGKWEDVSNGYTNAVDANVAFNMAINKSLNSGNYKLIVWAKRAGNTGINQDPNGLGDYDNNYCISFTCKPKPSTPIPTPTPTPTGGIKVCIDAGHGGSASGAVGPTKTMEKDITLQVTLKLGRILNEKGIDVIYTRTADDYLELSERCDISDSNNVDIFVSIHCNSYPSTAAGGIETFSYKTGTEGEKLAKSVQNELIKETGLTNRGTKTANFYVIKNTKAPSILTEIGFISNINEEQLLKSDEYQEKCANAIANGIMKYINK